MDKVDENSIVDNRVLTEGYFPQLDELWLYTDRKEDRNCDACLSAKLQTQILAYLGNHPTNVVISEEHLMIGRAIKPSLERKWPDGEIY
jgi:hypothetical protein